MISPDLQHVHRHKANTCLWLLNTDALAFCPDLYASWLEALLQDCPLRTCTFWRGFVSFRGLSSQFILVPTKQHGKKGLLISLSHYLFFPRACIFETHNDCGSNPAGPVCISGGCICTEPADKLG